MYKVNNAKYAKFFDLKEEANRIRKEIVKDIMKNNMEKNNASDYDKEYFEKNFDVLYECLIPSFKKGYIVDLKFLIFRKEFMDKWDITIAESIEFIKNMGLTLRYDSMLTCEYFIEEPRIIKLFKE